MFAVLLHDERGETLVGVGKDEAECRTLMVADALVRLARRSPSFRKTAEAVGRGAKGADTAMTAEDRAALDRALPRYSIARIG